MDNVQSDDQISGAPAQDIFSSDALFIDAEMRATRAERDRLKAELASRTEAWRQALRKLSESQAEVAKLRGEVAQVPTDELSHEDWANITGPATEDSQP